MTSRDETHRQLARYAGVWRRTPTARDEVATDERVPADSGGPDAASLVAAAERSLCDPDATRAFAAAGGFARLSCAVAATDDTWLAARGAAVLCAIGAGRPPVTSNETLGYGTGLREEPVAATE